MMLFTCREMPLDLKKASTGVLLGKYLQMQVAELSAVIAKHTQG